MRIYTVEGTLITAAWGEDPDVAAPGNPYIDAGTTVLPFPVPVLKKSSVIVNDVAPTNLSVGDTIAYTVEIDNKGLLPLGNTVVIDAPSTNLLYITNSTTYNGSPIPDSSPTNTAFPLDAPGYTIPVILSRGTSTFTYLCKVTTSGVVSNSVNIGGSSIFSATTLAPAPTNGASVTLNFCDTNGVPASLYSVGANVFVAMTNAVGNTSSNSVQTISVTVVDLTHGDLQTITLTETGTNSGVFRNIGGLPTSASSGLGQQDGILNITPGDILSVSYTDPNYGDSATSTAAIQIPALTRQLYLSVNGSTNGAQALNRVDPVAYVHSPTRTSMDLSGGTTISVDATDSGTTGATSASTLTVGHITGNGANRLMLVTVIIGDGVDASGSAISNVISIVYGAQALSFVGAVVDTSPALRTEIWRLLAPSIGSNNVVITLSGAQPIAAGATTFFNVDQTTPLGAFVSTNSIAAQPATRPVVVSSSGVGELVYAAVGVDGDGAATPPPTPTIGAGQTQLWTQTAQNRIYGASSTQPGAASVTNSWTWAGNNQQWTIAAVPIKPAASSGTNITAFTQTQGFCSNFVMPSNNLVVITNYITVTNGVMPVNPAVTATLQYNGTNIISLSSPTYSSVASNLVWSGLLTANITIPAGQLISCILSNGQSGVSFHVDYDSTNKPSKIILPASTVIKINTLGVYDAPYPGGNIVTAPVAGSTLYVRANVSDPFGSYDITSLGLTITAPSPSANVNTVLSDTSVVANDGCSKTYEYIWTTGPTTGSYALAATANEGTEGVSNSAGAGLSLIFLDLGTPSTTEFTSGNNGAATNAYPASAAGSVCVRVMDLNRNTNSATVQTNILATIISSTGDSEIILLSETGTNTGIFTACIATSTNSGAAPFDGTLYASVG